MSRNREGLLRELIRLKEILERMPNAFHTISMNPKSGENYVSPAEWVRWAKFSAPLSKRCPATSGLQFPPYLVMDAFLGRKKYDSFLGAEGVHLRAWLPSNWRAFIAAIEYHYQIPDYVAKSGDPELMVRNGEAHNFFRSMSHEDLETCLSETFLVIPRRRFVNTPLRIGSA